MGLSFVLRGAEAPKRMPDSKVKGAVTGRSLLAYVWDIV